MCACRIYSTPKPAPKEPKEGEAPAEGEEKPEETPAAAPEGEPEFNELLMGELASLETLGLEDGSKLEVEVFIILEVSVPGKGQSYHTKIEVSPDEPMSAIEKRVSFFKMFLQRGFMIYDPDQD